MANNSNSSFSKWVRSNRFILQVTALALGLLSPFILFLTLQSGQTGLAAIAFLLIAVGMLLTFIAG
jgi:hypothetical protein